MRWPAVRTILTGMRDTVNRDNTEEAGPVYRIIVLLATAIVVGLVASMAAIGFVESVRWLANTLPVTPSARAGYAGDFLPLPVATIVVPTLGGLIVGVLLHYCSSNKRPLGPADVIEAVQTRKALPGFGSGLTSTLAATVSLGFGASVGQYGPMVYLGAMLGNLVAALRLRIRDLPAIAVACGVAAAISTAFNAPIAGLIFAHEVVLRHFASRAFAPTTLAAATGYFIDNIVLDRPPLIFVDFDGNLHGHEFGLFAALGILASGIAILFMTLVLFSQRLAGRFPAPAPLRPATAGLLVGIGALWYPEILGIGDDVLRQTTVEGAFTIAELPALLIAKIVFTALCLGFGFAGGFFSPALLIGGLFGALFWMIVTSVTGLPTSGIAVYAICGMISVTGPVIGAPLTMILIVFELTRNYDIAIAAMVAVVMSNLIAHRLFARSIFDVQLAGRGFDALDGREQIRLGNAKVLDHCVTDYPVALPEETVSQACSGLADTGWRDVFVVDRHGIFRGMLADARVGADSTATAGAMVSEALVHFDENTTILQAIDRLEDFHGYTVPVVHSRSGKLLGVITEHAMLQAWREVARNLRREENAPL